MPLRNSEALRTQVNAVPNKKSSGFSELGKGEKAEELMPQIQRKRLT